MVGWQITATTIYCDAVDDYVALMVFKDWSVKCAGYKKYGENITKDKAKTLRKKSKKLGKELRCEGPECHRLIEYRDKLLAAEEKTKARSKS